MNKAIKLLEQRRNIRINVTTAGGVRCFDSAKIIYIATYGHKIVFHLADGEETGWGSLKLIEHTLTEYWFARSHKSFLINLRYVNGLSKDSVKVLDEELPLSQTMKKQFIEKLNAFLI